MDFITELCISTELSLIIVKSLEEADNNVFDFFDLFEGRIEFHNLMSTIRLQITEVVAHVITVK